MADLTSPFQLTRPAIRDYVTLLEPVFLLETLPSWHSNRLNRLIKAPKLHVGDTGSACALLGLDAATLAKDRPTLGQLNMIAARGAGKILLVIRTRVPT